VGFLAKKGKAKTTGLAFYKTASCEPFVAIVQTFITSDSLFLNNNYWMNFIITWFVFWC
jgi:hypothetical protein